MINEKRAKQLAFDLAAAATRAFTDNMEQFMSSDELPDPEVSVNTLRNAVRKAIADYVEKLTEAEAKMLVVEFASETGLKQIVKTIDEAIKERLDSFAE